MKRDLAFILVLLFLHTQLFGAVQYWQKESSYTHLVEINGQWKNFKGFAPNYAIAFSADKDRIAYHLDLVISYLDSHNPNDFTKKQIAKRKQLLFDLKKYSIERHFPRNTYHDVRTPYFIDNYNNYCAVGYLMKVSGADDLAKEISKNENYNYVEDIKTPGVAEWAFNNGFTVNELKWIQPNYGPNTFVKPVNKGVNGPITAACLFDGKVYLAGKFDSIGHKPSNGFAIYHGGLENWKIPVEGNCTDIMPFDDGFIMVGNLKAKGSRRSLLHLGSSGSVTLFEQFKNKNLRVYKVEPIDSKSFYAVAKNKETSNSIIYKYENGLWDEVMTLNGKVNYLKSNIVIGDFNEAIINAKDSQITLNLGFSNLLLNENGKWFSPKAMYPSVGDLATKFLCAKKIGDSLILIGINPWSSDSADLMLYSKVKDSLIKKEENLIANGHVIDFSVSGNYMTYWGAFNIWSMHEGTNCGVFDLVNNWQTRPIAGASSDTIFHVFKLGEGTLLAGNFTIGIYFTEKAIQTDIKYLGWASNTPSSINNIEPTFKIYPNPAKNELHVRLTNLSSAVKEIELFTINGQKIVLPYVLNADEARIKTYDLKPGNYILKVTMMDGSNLSSYFLKE